MSKNESPTVCTSLAAHSEDQKEAHSDSLSRRGLPSVGKTAFWNRPIAKYDPVILAFVAWSIAALFVLECGGFDFISWALLTSIYLQFRSKASVDHWLLSILLGVPIILIQPRLFVFFALAVGCTAVAAYRVAERSVSVNNLIPLFIVFFVFYFGVVHAIVLHLTPHTIDAGMMSFDHRWFSDVSISTWHWAIAHPCAYYFFVFVYLSMPCVATLILINLAPRNVRKTVAVLLMATGCVAPFYLLFPAVGPAHIGDPTAHRNCMPSLHMTWAILLWRAAKPGWARYGMAFFALLTAVSTLTTGEHYFIDLLAAIPLAGCWALAIPSE